MKIRKECLEANGGRIRKERQEANIGLMEPKSMIDSKPLSKLNHLSNLKFLFPPFPLFPTVATVRYPSDTTFGSESRALDRL